MQQTQHSNNSRNIEEKYGGKKIEIAIMKGGEK
jgi:hypothetical protein